MADSELFVDTAIRLVSMLGTSFFYTLDGSEPDTCSACIPIPGAPGDRTTEILGIPKTGWGESPVAERLFCKAGIKLPAATLLTAQ